MISEVQILRLWLSHNSTKPHCITCTNYFWVANDLMYSNSLIFTYWNAIPFIFGKFEHCYLLSGAQWFLGSHQKNSRFKNHLGTIQLSFWVSSNLHMWPYSQHIICPNSLYKHGENLNQKSSQIVCYILYIAWNISNDDVSTKLQEYSWFFA